MRLRQDIVGPVGLLAALISIGAGIYLVTSESAAEQSTVFDVLFDGAGAYFVARGVWMVSVLLRVPHREPHD